MKIAILPNLDKTDAYMYTVKIVRLLVKLRSNVCMFFKYKSYFNFKQITFYQNFYKMLEQCDIVLVVGGDGSIIHASKHAALAKKPILGINLGRVGFVAGLEKNELDKLKQLVNGDYKTEKRVMLQVDIELLKKRKRLLAFNDVVISRNAFQRVIDFEVSINSNKLSNYRADGIIVATPTGSTAYSLSAGGPIIEPTIKCMILTPICSHTLFSRPIVCDKNSKLSIKTLRKSYNQATAYLSVDGEHSIKISEKDNVNIQISKTEVCMIQLYYKNSYSKLNAKL